MNNTKTWISVGIYIYNEIFSAITGKMSLAAMWIYLEDTILNEVSQGEEEIHHMFSLFLEAKRVDHITVLSRPESLDVTKAMGEKERKRLEKQVLKYS
jgi:hypothetical protein